MKIGDFSNAGESYKALSQKNPGNEAAFANITDKFQRTPDLPKEADLKKAAEILTRTTKPKAEKLWSGNVGGYLRNSPFIASDGAVYCSSADKKIHAFNPVTGREIWSKETEKGFQAGVTQLSDGSIVAVGLDNRNDSNVYGLDPKTGEEKWRFRWDPQWGIANSYPPQAAPDGTLYLNHEFRMIAVDPTTHQVKTIIKYGGKSASPPTFSPDGKTAYVNTDSVITAFDTQTGKQKWQTERRDITISDSPVTGKDGTIYCGNFSKELIAVDPDTGKKKWMFKAGGSIMASPSVGPDGTIYAASFDNKIYAVDPDTGKEKWSFKGLGEMRLSPVPGPDGLVCLVSDRNIVYGLDEKTGAKAWEFQAPSYVHNPPVFDKQGNFYMGCNDNHIHAWSDSYGKMKVDLLKDKGKQDEDPLKTEDSPTIRQGKDFVDIGGVKLQVRNDRE